MADRTPGEWFLGQWEPDPGETDYDGCIYAPPTPEDIADAEAARGTPQEFDPVPYVVAHVDFRPDAEFIVRMSKVGDELAAIVKELLAIYNRPGVSSNDFADMVVNRVMPLCEAVALKLAGEG